jgi:hypothetical protein
MDDRTFPSVHVRHNLEGLLGLLPPGYLLSFAASAIGEPLGTAGDVSLYMRSRMPGILGLTYRASDLTADDRQAIAEEIARYKQIRDTVREASGRVLTPQAGSSPPPWDAVEEVSPSGDAVVFAFQNDRSDPIFTVQPDGLDAEARYLVTDADGRVVGSATGRELMEDGVTIEASPASAAHVLHLQRQEPAGVVGLRLAR